MQVYANVALHANCKMYGSFMFFHFHLAFCFCHTSVDSSTHIFRWQSRWARGDRGSRCSEIIRRVRNPRPFRGPQCNDWNESWRDCQLVGFRDAIVSEFDCIVMF